ncbi:hypothetical protein RHMOL_Rhmol04G0121500 [Rhododendron molle]|uniref:Uncharacterized protein n=1 Tax=Rhododendron molle TaxID=49168 RepID=A0ACC0NZD6_RHOML|nr:hypothetical protein RHMOL_Rhmol04G0121500 [Rhododendron molle]
MAEAVVYSGRREQEEEDFDGDFKKYMDGELEWSRLKSSDNFVDLNPNAPAISEVRDKLRQAIQKLILYPELNASLVQFWAPTTEALEGRTLLTTQNQPFALGKTSDKLGLCEYRMISKDCKFYVDRKSGEQEEGEQLGLPGRVFLYQLHESAPNVEHYSVNEYPQRHLGSHCPIKATWAVPVFEHSSQTCVGVLELVSSMENLAFWYRRSFISNLDRVFKEQGLQCFDLYKHYEMQRQYENEDLKTASTKIRMLIKAVCENHSLPLALAWVPCGDCDALLRGHSVGYCNNDQFLELIMVSQAHHIRQGQGVVGWALSSPNLSYCSDVTQFSIAEYPLVPYARKCRLSACFAICLQSSCTGNDVYILEFFLPSSYKDVDDSWISFSRILGTIKEVFKNFKLASGQELGEELSVAVIDFQNGQKLRSVHIIPAGRSLPGLEPLQNGGVTMQLCTQDQPSMEAINNAMTFASAEGNNISSFLPRLEPMQNGGVTMQLDSLDQPSMNAMNSGMNFVNTEEHYVCVTSSDSSEEEGTTETEESEHKRTGVRIDVSLEDILQCSNLTRDNAASKLEVSVSTLKPPHNVKNINPTRPLLVDQERIPPLSSVSPSNQAPVSVAHVRPHDTAFQNANMVTIRAKYVNNITLKFGLSTSSGITELRQQVAKRLNLEPETYNIRYTDEDGEVILLACDDDLQDCIHASKSLGNTSVVVLLEPK